MLQVPFRKLTLTEHEKNKGMKARKETAQASEGDPSGYAQQAAGNTGVEATAEFGSGPRNSCRGDQKWEDSEVMDTDEPQPEQVTEWDGMGHTLAPLPACLPKPCPKSEGKGDAAEWHQLS